ncbi:LysR family transcriptional regulator [Rhizobium sp. Leaf371]|uniref:LysR family transcriptional regulator n=1 Tax=Rhizobium sp. Leaf371 TaxID=1736355 RepID=UPI0009E9E4FF|nr:LysR family transcriptional regulator [Rhizobium sp. Leaf371]
MPLRQTNTVSDEHAAFLARAATGSFVKAACLLGRHATVVTKRVQALEQRLGVRLVERTTRRLRLTEAGQTLADRLRVAAEVVSDAEREPSASVDAVRGELRVTLPAIMGRLWLARKIPNFIAEHPELHLEVH